jgi:hypothetical protein
MHRLQKSSALFLLFALALTLVILPQPSASGIARLSADADRPNPSDDDAVPAFHTAPPEGALPATMDPAGFSDALVQNAYTVAARVKKVLYQEPCYCHCDRSQGHTGLLDCFVSAHGSGCGICIREDLYTYEQTRKGKTPAQIREGIIQGEWQNVDVTRYQTALPAAHK